MIALRGWWARPGCTIAITALPMAVMVLVCFGPALFRDRQFGYRDAGHHYYPLHERVQREWSAGRWPLWQTEENAGMPLLGDPTAAVLYPGKLLFALLPYPLAARLYIVGHVILAWAAMLLLVRSWGLGPPAASIAAISYAFGAPILFQTCNVIFLVGAAWLPLGVRAVDRWVRLARGWALLELAIVLAMQALGGDPETAYLLGASAAGYAIGLARLGPGVVGRDDSGPRHSAWRAVRWAVILIAAAVAWFAATVALGIWLPGLRPRAPAGQPRPLAWMAAMPLLVAAGWAAWALTGLVRWNRSGRRSPLVTALAGLGLSAVLAFAVAAAQLLPVLEYTRLTQRADAGESSHDVYPFSLEPFRLVELIWPDVFGTTFGAQSAWSGALPLPGTRPLVWVPSLYLGVLTLCLALGALSARGGPPWRIWLAAMALIGLAGGMGQYTSPIWATRAVATVQGGPAARTLLRQLGSLDPPEPGTIRADGRLRDGDGGFYWWMTQLLPGFRQFRFPSKLLVFTALAVCALAGIGWEAMAAGCRRVTMGVLTTLVALSLVLLATAGWKRPAILAAFRAVNLDTIFGPFDPAAGFAAIVGAFLQTTALLGAGMLAIALAKSRPVLAGAIVTAAVTADLALANAHYVVTIPQAILGGPSEALAVIQAAEDRDPSPGPFRVHRMPVWIPPGWKTLPSPDRPAGVMAWELDTLQSKFGINRGIAYTYSLGVGELAAYTAFFRGFFCPIRDPEAARRMELPLDRPIVYFPRRSFDLWNTRYFIVPIHPGDWVDEQRSYASFLYRSERIHPPADNFSGPDGRARYKLWADTRDFQVLRNDQAYPRAWVVHDARPVPTLKGSALPDRRRCLDEMTYCHDLWREKGLSVYEPRSVAWIDESTRRELAHYLPGAAPRPPEPVEVRYPDPQHVEIAATLVSPGIVVLSDVDYPGWELTIDGRPAPIVPVNLAMRGAAVEAGRHRLVYSYHPRSFLIGRTVSVVGLVASVVLAAGCLVRRGGVGRLSYGK